MAKKYQRQVSTTSKRGVRDYIALSIGVSQLLLGAYQLYKRYKR